MVKLEAEISLALVEPDELRDVRRGNRAKVDRIIVAGENGSTVEFGHGVPLVQCITGLGLPGSVTRPPGNGGQAHQRVSESRQIVMRSPTLAILTVTLSFA
jgi:hypothetical protein